MELLSGVEKDFVSLEELQNEVAILRTIEVKPKQPIIVEVLDIKTGITTIYRTKTEAGQALSADLSVFREGRSNLYKQRYQITVLKS